MGGSGKLSQIAGGARDAIPAELARIKVGVRLERCYDGISLEMVQN